MMNKKILLIEDDDQLQLLYGDQLADAGFEVLFASTGKMGLSITKSEKIDLIILDIMLSGIMNGFDILEIFKKDEELKKIPVIILTNLDSEEDAARKIGVSDYFVKIKTKSEDVVNRIKEILNYD